MSGKESIRPLLVHPVPEADDTMLWWIKKLAGSNNVDNRTMFVYITGLAKKHGFFQALHALTRVPLERIKKMENEFRDEYWENTKRCPLKTCEYTAKWQATIRKHLKKFHDI
jgi:hypothetical protein